MIWAIIAVLVIVIMIAAVCFMSESKEVANTRYEVRFEPGNNKYYIVKISKGKEENVLGRWKISTLYYSSKIDADFVVQKLNIKSSETVEEPKEPKEVK